MNSPLVKSFGDERIAAGETRLVVDLGACTGMDSTFMGTLAGLAARIAAQSGEMHVAEADARNRASLEDLGLDFMMSVNPPEADWCGQLEEIRGGLKLRDKQAGLPTADRARHVLEAHQTLSSMNESNARAFEGVVDTLERQTSGGKPPHEGGGR